MSTRIGYHPGDDIGMNDCGLKPFSPRQNNFQLLIEAMVSERDCNNGRLEAFYGDLFSLSIFLQSLKIDLVAFFVYLYDTFLVLRSLS